MFYLHVRCSQKCVNDFIGYYIMQNMATCQVDTIDRIEIYRPKIHFPFSFAVSSYQCKECGSWFRRIFLMLSLIGFLASYLLYVNTKTSKGLSRDSVGERRHRTWLVYNTDFHWVFMRLLSKVNPSLISLTCCMQTGLKMEVSYNITVRASRNGELIDLFN